MKKLSFLFFILFMIAAGIGAYFGYYVARVDRTAYLNSTEYQIDVLEKRLSNLDSNIEQLETEAVAPIAAIQGKSFQSKLLQEEQKILAKPKLMSELLKEKLAKKKQEKKALLEKKTALKKGLKEKAKSSLTAIVAEKINQVNQLKQKAAFWLTHAKDAIPADITMTVVGGELTDSQKAQLALAFRLFPSDFPKQIKLIVTYADPNMRNGMAGKGIIILKGQNQDLFFETVVHEAGHAYGLRGGGGSGSPSGFYDLQIPLLTDDPTVPYYQFSWKDNATKYNEAFPSVYGQTDPFEDYAESYIYYILQGKAFRDEAKLDPVKAQKYEFMKRVFNGKEFESFTDFKGTLFSIQEYGFDPERYFSANPL